MTRPVGMTPEMTMARYNRWRAMYEGEELTMPEIGKREGVSAYSVGRGLRKAGATPRSRAGHPFLLRRATRRIAELEHEVRRLNARLRLLGATEAA